MAQLMPGIGRHQHGRDADAPAPAPRRAAAPRRRTPPARICARPGPCSCSAEAEIDGHLRVDDAQHALGRAARHRGRAARPSASSSARRAARARRAAGARRAMRVGRERPQHQVRIGHGGLGPALAVAGRAGRGAGAASARPSRARPCRSMAMVPPPAPKGAHLEHRRTDILAGDIALGGFEHAAVGDHG